MKTSRLIILSVTALSLASCSYMPAWMGGKKAEIVRLPGERITVLPVANELKASDDIKSMAIILPPVNENSEWPQHSGMFSSRASNLGGKGNFEHEESSEAGGGESFAHTLIPRPVVGGNAVFAMDAEGKISAHEAANIENRKFISPGVSEEDESDVNGGGLAYDNGRVYAVSGRGAVAAIDAANGNIIWKKTGFSPFRSAPRVANGKLFAITIDSQLLALDAASGEVVWDHRGIDETAGLMNSVSPTIAGDTIIVPYESGELYALSSIDGREIWSNSLSLAQRNSASSIFSGIGGDPVIDDSVVFAVSNGGAVAVYGLAGGQRVWDRPVASVNTPWLSGDYLFMLSADNTLAAFLKYDGRVRWAVKLPSFEGMENKRRPIFWRGPVLVDGRLAVVGSRGEMKLFSATEGRELATVSIPSDVYTAPVVAGGRIYLVTQSAKLYSLQ